MKVWSVKVDSQYETSYYIVFACCKEEARIKMIGEAHDNCTVIRQLFEEDTCNYICQKPKGMVGKL